MQSIATQRNDYSTDDVDSLMLLARNIVYHFYDYSCFAPFEEVGLEAIVDGEPDEELNDREPSNTSESAFEQIRSIDGLA